MTITHTHPKDCADRKEAAADRKTHEANRVEHETRQQALAHAVWFDWYKRSPS